MAPETLGLSVVASLGAVIVNDLVAEHTASFVKDELPKLGESLKKDGKQSRSMVPQSFLVRYESIKYI